MTGQNLDELERVLRSAGLPYSGPAAHGLLTGCLVANAGLSAVALERSLGDADPLTEHGLQGLHEAVERLRIDLLRALNDTELGFEPLLPDAADLLDRRTRALGDWVDAFLGGFGQTKRAVASEPSAQAMEILRDFAEIARIDPEPEDDEANERALAELHEYVRVGVMLLADEFTPASPRTGIPLQ